MSVTVNPTSPAGRGGVYDRSCPTRAVLTRIADKWTGLVLGRLGAGPMRFLQLQRSIDGVSQKMLTETLRSLERDGLVTRTVHAQVPPRVDYAITELGRSLETVYSGIRSWAEAHVLEVLDAQRAYDDARLTAGP